MDNSELETEAGTLAFTGHYGDEKGTVRKKIPGECYWG